jgi:hypothetical protein
MTTHMTSEGATKYPISSAKKKDLDVALARFIAEDLRPLQMLEGKGFQKFVAKLDPRYIPPTRKTMRNTIIPKLTDEGKKEICEELYVVNWVAVTTDMWTSKTTTAFMAVTVHYLNDQGLTSRLLDCSPFHIRHTSENLKERLLDVIADFDISEKVVAAVTDNAANVKKAIADADIKHIPCFAHTLNLCVTAALMEMPELVQLRNKISALVTFTRKSCNAKEDFSDCQVRLNMRFKSLVQDVKTRWNSLYLMIDRYIELRQAIVLLLTMDSCKDKDFALSSEEWKVAEELRTLLAPAFEATVELSGESYVSGSKVIPISKSLITWYAAAGRRYALQQPNSFGQRFADALLQRIIFQLGPSEMVSYISIYANDERRNNSCNCVKGMQTRLYIVRALGRAQNSRLGSRIGPTALA